MEKRGRRFFVGDLHGCALELERILRRFGFRPGEDRLFSTGDVVGKGPDAAAVLEILESLGASAVQGNHDEALLRYAALPEAERTLKQRAYLDSLGERRDHWLKVLAGWPPYLEMEDLILVHAGLEPGKESLAAMHPRILRNIRTWDGKGSNLNRPSDPPWFECVQPAKTVVFGHWAQRGKVDLPRFKGLDTGCVYGHGLTGWCPEEGRFYQEPSERVYLPVRAD